MGLTGIRGAATRCIHKANASLDRRRWSQPPGGSRETRPQMGSFPTAVQVRGDRGSTTGCCVSCSPATYIAAAQAYEARPTRPYALGVRLPRSRPAVLLGSAVAALLIAVAGWMVTRGSASTSPGPLTTVTISATGIAPTSLETPVTIGDWFLANPSHGLAVVDRITLIRPDPGLRVLGLKLAHFDRHSVGAYDGYPRKGQQLYAVNELPIRPGERVEIVAGLQINKTGSYRAHGLMVDYHIGDKHYRLMVPEAVALCYPASKRHPCQAPLPA